MDTPKLRQLTRTQLQSIAKQEVVRAVGKTEDIIRRLIKKHPKGVPLNEVTENSATPSEMRRKNVLRKDGHSIVKDEARAGPSNGIPVDPSTVVPAVSPQETASPSEQPPGNATPVFDASDADPSEVSIEELHDRRDVDTRSVYSDDPRAEGGPDENMFIDTLRQFTTLVNTVPTIESRIAESQRLLDRTTATLDKATPDLRELCVTREYVEVFLMGKMKKKKELWDGTGKMKKGPRKFRMEWLRSQRKANSVKRWQEANRTNEAHGLNPEPYEWFASESEEEVIESLQTTPASSRCGSPKRGREGTVETDNNQRKRPRS
ncbi:hypothetical protein BS17DRAFT_336981 [Gyrodon lividus]|nr:hypothetical protein BS17DRAFT_336981 [Gyrodon lividus]